MTLEDKLKILRRQWKLADPSMRKVIEARAKSLKLSEECKNDPESKRIMKALG